nr:TAXI family TRAP transporter solute-binding subunit [Psychromonas ossibalaenae]
MDDTPHYFSYDIPGGTYQGNEQTITTLASKATIIASSQTSTETIYKTVKAVFENLDTFRSMHPGLADIDKSDMLDGHTAPMHPGAVKYFKEAGLLL